MNPLPPVDPDRNRAEQAVDPDRNRAEQDLGRVERQHDAGRRPTSLDPHELGFTPRGQVPWLSPSLLLRTGLRSALAMTFGAYLDKRELQGALPAKVYDQPGEDGELWLDYVADLGDGFDATYSIAYLLAQPTLTVAGPSAEQVTAPEQESNGGPEPAERLTLPRARTLVFGGDLVYPSASKEQYEDRCKGPYAAAFPRPPADGPAPTLYALPANHDWYDGLTAFLRLFVGERTDHVGGWRTEQSRSYFAVRLPHDWWLFAVDEAFGGYIDDPQLVYFERAAKELGPQSKVILVVPEPSWGKADPDGYDTLDFFLRTIVTPTGARVPLMISGDQHYYARYHNPDRQLITCGGGGAYLTATHTLPKRITVPPKESIVRKASPRREYELTARYPDASRSRRLGWGVFGRLPVRNPGFGALVGIVHMFLMLAVAGAASQFSDTDERLATIPLLAMVVLILSGAVGFAYFPTGRRKSARHFLAGSLHGAVHLGIGLAGGLLWLRFPFQEWPWPLPLVAAAVLYVPVAGLVASQVIAAYLLLGSRLGFNLNELFAAQGIEDYKSFLRLRIGPDGALTVYPVVVDRACRRWRPDPEATRPDASWLAPERPLRARLAEPPIRIT